MANYLGVRVWSIPGFPFRHLLNFGQVIGKTAHAGPSGNEPDDEKDVPRAQVSGAVPKSRTYKDSKGSTSQSAVEESQSEKDNASGFESDVVEVPITRNEKPASKPPAVSEYERIRESNIKRNQKLLDEIMQDSGTNLRKDMAAPPGKKGKAVSSCSSGRFPHIDSSRALRLSKQRTHSRHHWWKAFKRYGRCNTTVVRSRF